MSRVLIFRPSWELVTEYGRAWMGEIARIAQSLGHTVMDLAGEEATQANMMTALESFKPDLVFACSHGNETQFSGQNGEIVFTACQNDETMTGTQASFLSCLMGQVLAPSMNDKDALAVAAYTSEFTFMLDTNYADRPLEDPLAQPFTRAIIEPARSLLRGGTWRNFYDVSVRMFNLGVQEWFESDDPNAAQLVACLEQDRDSLAVFGETNISPAGTPVTVAKIIAPIIAGATLIYISNIL